MSPSSTTPSDHDRQVITSRLKEATGGALDVDFLKTAFINGDESGNGHIYSAKLHCENDDDVMFLDDRGPDSLEVQLVAELRRFGKLFMDLAEQAEKNLSVC